VCSKTKYEPLNDCKMKPGLLTIANAFWIACLIFRGIARHQVHDVQSQRFFRKRYHILSLSDRVKMSLTSITESTDSRYIGQAFLVQKHGLGMSHCRQECAFWTKKLL